MAKRYAGLFAGSLAALAILASSAPAQVLTADPPPGTVQVVLTPVGGEPGPPPLAAADGTLPGIFPNNLRVDVGFEYVRPDFPSRAVTLVVPTGVNSSFATLAGDGNVSFDFGFVPKISVDYQFADLGFGATASGKLNSFSGHLTRTIDAAAGSANLTANSTVNLAVANLVEGSKYLPLDRFACFENTCLEDTVVLATLGSRYSHVAQDYTANLSSGANSSTLTAHQDWDGFGLTTSLSVLQPLPADFFLYGVSRGSFLVGTNNRNSVSAVVVSGNAAASSSTKVTENKTEFIPVGEFEVGVAWGAPLFPKQAEALAAAGTAGPLGWVKAGLIADLWGGLGLLSSAQRPHEFSDSSLFLFGFSVMAGVEF